MSSLPLFWSVYLSCLWPHALLTARRMDDAEACFILSNRFEVDRIAAVRSPPLLPCFTMTPPPPPPHTATPPCQPGAWLITFNMFVFFTTNEQRKNLWVCFESCVFFRTLLHKKIIKAAFDPNGLSSLHRLVVLLFTSLHKINYTKLITQKKQ